MKMKFFIAALFFLVITLNVSSVIAQTYAQDEILSDQGQDLMVWVTNYEPKILRSDLLEENDVSIYAQLKGIQVNPFISIPKIDSVSLRPSSLGKNTNVVGLSYIRPNGIVTADDLGWLVVTIKRIPTQDKMPDTIDLNVSATIDYSFEDLIGFGTKDITLGIVNEQEWRNNEWKYEFWGNSGFLRLSELSTDNQAKIELFDSAKNSLGTIALTAGQKSIPYLVNVDGKRGYVTFTLQGIETPSSYAKISVNIDGKKSENIVRQNSPLYAGSEWTVVGIEPKSGGAGNLVIRNNKGEQKSLSIETRSVVITENNADKTRTIGDKVGEDYIAWIADKAVYFIKTDNLDRALSSINGLVKSKGLSKAFDYAKSQSIIKDYHVALEGQVYNGATIKTASSLKYNQVLDNAEAKKYFDAALNEYNEISSGIDVPVRSDTGISSVSSDKGYVAYNQSWTMSALWRAYEFANNYDQAKAAEFLKNLAERYPNEVDKDKWQSEIDKLFNLNYANAKTYITDRGKEVSVILEEINNPELAAKAYLVAGGIQGEYKQGAVVDSDYYLEQVTNTGVTIRKYDNSASWQIAVNNERELNSTSHFSVKVLSTKVEKEARVTIAPYNKNGHTVTNFTLHVGVEKRGIQLNPAQINDQIKNAEDQIKQLEKITSQMASTITGLRNTCFATYTFLLVKKLFDWSGTAGKARNLVMRGIDGNSGWIKFCEDNITGSRKAGIFKNSVEDCLWDNRDKIDKQLKLSETAIKSVSSDLGQYFDEANNVKNYADLAGKFSSEEVKNMLSNQNYLKSKLGTAQLTRDDIEKFYLYQNLQSQGKDTLVGTDAEEKLKALTQSYSKDSQVISILQSQVPADSADFSKLTKEQKQNRIDSWTLAQGYVMKQSAKAVSDRAVASKIEVDALNPSKAMASSDDLSGVPVEVLKNSAGDWIYTSPEGKKITVVIGQNCAGKQKISLMEAYGSGLYKGLPARVPFSQGWSEVTEYDSNKNPKQMTIHVTTAMANGQCPDIIYNANQDMNAFIEADRSIVQGASNCVASAVSSTRTKQTSFTCEGRAYGKGSDYTPRAEQNYCQDFFSESDCNVLYQVCDPVICPASRCDFGGRFKVDNVIQAGLFGSIFLCAPNFPTPFIAVCLPGLRAGLMNYKTVLQGYKDCMKRQLDKGETVGICDRITSLYWCDLLWKTVLTMYDKLGGFYGIMQGTFDKSKGGGEYLSANTGLQEAQKSFSYFTSVYAEDVFAKFNALTTEQIGAMVCQRAIYGTIPTSMDVFAELSNPETPPQFFGHVEESAYSSVGQPTSHYKIYYHIYSGEDKGVYYKVYLSSPISSAFATTPLAEYLLDAGYLEKGGYIDKSPDIIARSGYRQLCIDIDGVPHCGFGWVSSEAAVQELTDQYAASLASSQIQNEKDCMFSSPALVGSLVGPAVEGTDLLARRGINRICSSGDPNAGSGTRVWDAVGFCDQKAGIKCWLDLSSVQGAIKDLKIEYDVMNTPPQSVELLIKEGYKTNDEVKKKLDEAYKEYTQINPNYLNVITLCENILKEAAPTQSGLLYEARFIKALSYEKLFELEVKKIKFKELEAITGSKYSAQCKAIEYKSTIQEALAANSISKWGSYDAMAMTMAMIQQESCGGTCAETSSAGARGLMQVLPTTASGVLMPGKITIDSKQIGKKDYENSINAQLVQAGYNLDDSLTNIKAGTKFFDSLYRKYNNMDNALGYYYAGDLTGPNVNKAAYSSSVKSYYLGCNLINSLQSISGTSQDRICAIAKLYKGLEVTRDGDPSNTCARFVTEVLHYADYSIEACATYDAVDMLESWLKSNNAAQISYENLKCGDIVIVKSSLAPSGRHIAIFESAGKMMGEPGTGVPVSTQDLSKSIFLVAYRLESTQQAETTPIVYDYTISYNSSIAEGASSLADRFYGGTGYTPSKKASDIDRIKQANSGKTSFSANEIITIKMNNLEFDAFRKRYSLTSASEGCSAPANKQCSFGIKLAGSGSTYYAEGKTECYYEYVNYITPNAEGVSYEEHCWPCSKADDCNDFNSDPVKCTSVKCFSQSKISAPTQTCVYETPLCNAYGVENFVSDANKNAESNPDPLEKINLYKSIINYLPQTQYSRDAINKAYKIAESTANYFALVEYASSEWESKDYYVYSIGVKANERDTELKLARPVFDYYNSTLTQCLSKIPINNYFCKCEIASEQFQKLLELNNFGIMLDKKAGGNVNLQLIYPTSSEKIVIASQPMPFSQVCYFTGAFSAARWVGGGNAYFSTITNLNQALSEDSISLTTSSHLFKINNVPCVYPQGFVNEDYSLVEQCYP